MAVQAKARAKFANQLNVFAEMERFIETAAGEEFVARRDEADAASHAKRRLAQKKAEIEETIAEFAAPSAIDGDKPGTGDGEREMAVTFPDPSQKMRMGRVVGIEKNEKFAPGTVRAEVALPRDSSFAFQKRDVGEIARDLRGCVVGLAVADQNFEVGRVSLVLQRQKQRAEARCFVESGDNDGNCGHTPSLEIAGHRLCIFRGETPGENYHAKYKWQTSRYSGDRWI